MCFQQLLDRFVVILQLGVVGNFQRLGDADPTFFFFNRERRKKRSGLWDDRSLSLIPTQTSRQTQKPRVKIAVSCSREETRTPSRDFDGAATCALHNIYMSAKICAPFPGIPPRRHWERNPANSMMHFDAKGKVFTSWIRGKIWRLTIDLLLKDIGRGGNQLAEVLIANSLDVITHNESLRQIAAAAFAQNKRR